MVEVFNNQFWYDVVWALLHSIWQAAIIALLLGVLLRRISARKATLRYWLACGAMLSLVLATFSTFHIRNELRNLPRLVGLDQTSSHAAYPAVSGPPSAILDNASSAAMTPLAPTETWLSLNWTALAAMLWIVGVSFMVLRTIVAVVRGNQLSSVTRIESRQHLDLLTAQSQKLGLKRVPSFWSSLTICTPYAVGVLSPAIVVPMSMLTSLSSSELQAVLAHELAHIRRNDYLANLFQMVVEAAYFFNPALWWISRQVRVEREACCDQVAIETSSNQIRYATILANWMETVAASAGARPDEVPASGLAFADKKPSSMLERIQRILKPDSKPQLRVSPWNWVFVIAASVIIGCGVNVGSKAVTTVALQALSDSERVAQIEEKQDNLETGPHDEFEKGVAKIRGRITTEDGGEVEGGYIRSSSKHSGGFYNSTEGRFKGDEDYEVSVRSGIACLFFSSENYAPAFIGPIKAVKDGEITHDVKLIRGAPHLVHVVDEYSQPVLGAEVQMHPEPLRGPISKPRSDRSGNYTFEYRNPGKKSKLSVKKHGYITHNSVVTNDGRTDVTLVASPICKGVVLSANGAPVANAEIRISSIEDPARHFNMEQKPIATTDEMGKFETPALSPTGIHEIIVVSDQGMAYVDNVVVSKDLKFMLRPACSMDVTIKGDLEQLYRSKNGDLRLGFYQRAGRSQWEGHIQDGEVEVVKDSEDLVRVKLKHLLPGPFELQSGKFKHKMEAEHGNHSVDIIAADATLTPPMVELIDVKVNFQCDGAIVKPGGALGIGPNYNSFAPLEDGVLKVTVAPKKYYLTPDRLIGFTFEEQHIEVELGEANDFTIEVEPAGAVSGTIVDSNGQPVSASVSCKYEISRPEFHRSAGLANHYHSDNEGKFLLTPIPIGAKQVIVKAGDRFNPAVSQELLIEASNPVVEVKLQTAPPAKAMVRVVDHEGNPLPGVDLEVKLLVPRARSWGGSLSTNAQGEAEISPLHPTWDYEVTAKPVRGFVSGTVDLVQEETNILRLQPGSVVRGQLIDKEGNPVLRRRVYALFEYERSLHGVKSWINADRDTDSQGRFEFTRLPRTECEINSDGADPVTVDAGDDDEPIILRLK